jgi:hypothetical protein
MKLPHQSAGVRRVAGCAGRIATQASIASRGVTAQRIRVFDFPDVRRVDPFDGAGLNQYPWSYSNLWGFGVAPIPR